MSTKEFVVYFKAALLLSLALSSNQLLAQASSGYSGDEGNNGQHKTITAIGPISINLSGGYGGSGQDGSDGSSGKCESYTNDQGNTVNNDVSGQDGGRGGNGGDGGNGGNLTVLFTDVVNLKDIHFIAQGGDYGYGGDGGKGGYGCPSGKDGENGWTGNSGNKGNLYLVAQEFFPYQIDTSGQMDKISTLMKGRNIVKNIWEATDGKALVAGGSDFGASFVLKSYEYGSAQVVLKDASKIDPRFLETNLYVGMNQGITSIQAYGDVMMVAKHSADSANAVLEIERLYNTYDFKSIGFETVIKKNTSRFIHMTTKTDLLPRPTLSMTLKVEVKGRFFKYHEAYNDEVPASMIEAIKAGYTIDLDALPLKIKIPSEGKVRLSMKYKLQEMDLKTEGEEVWVIKMKNIGAVEAIKEN
jgi:hypothetical protein